MKKLLFLMCWIASGFLASYAYEKTIGEEDPFTMGVHFVIPPISLAATGIVYLAHQCPKGFRIFK